jgi:hypothetical protein
VTLASTGEAGEEFSTLEATAKTILYATVRQAARRARHPFDAGR